MSKTAIVVDSASYISKQIRDRYDIFMIDLPIILSDEVFYDNKTWKGDNKKFYKDLEKKNKSMPSTSQATPGEILSVLDKVKELDYDNAIILTLSSGISGMYNTVKNIAENYKGLNVVAWDTLVTAVGAAYQGIASARMAQEGKSVPEILEVLDKIRSNTRVYFVVNDINFLKRTGRLRGGQALIGSILNIKPILTFDKEGKIVAIGKERHMKRAWNNIKKRLLDDLSREKNIRVSVANANDPELSKEWVDDLRGEESLNHVEFDETILGPSIGVHTGEKAMGLLWTIDYKDIT